MHRGQGRGEEAEEQEEAPMVGLVRLGAWAAVVLFTAGDSLWRRSRPPTGEEEEEEEGLAEGERGQEVQEVETYCLVARSP